MNNLEEAATGLLVNTDVEVGSPRRLQWHLPPELVEDYFLHTEPRAEKLELLGIPVTQEFLLGEDTIVLTETLGVATVARETVL